MEEEPARQRRTRRQRRSSRGEVGARGDPFKGLAAPSGQSPKSSGAPKVRVMHIASVQELQEAGLCLVSDPHRTWECLCTLPVASISRGQCFRGVARVSRGGEACCPHTLLFCGVSLRLMGACVSLSSPSPSHFREHLTLWLRVSPKMLQTCPGTSALPRCSPGRAGARHCMGWGAGGPFRQAGLWAAPRAGGHSLGRLSAEWTRREPSQGPRGFLGLSALLPDPLTS